MDDANILVGANRHITTYSEASWGVAPDPIVYQHLPLTNYDIRITPEMRESQASFGNFGDKGYFVSGIGIAGSMGGVLHGMQASTVSLAQYVLNWAFGNPTSNDLPSFAAELADGPDIANKLHTGLRCGKLTLTGSESSGRVEWSGDFMGKTEEEVATAQTVPNDLEGLKEFDFSAIVLEINSVAVPFSSFTLTRDNMLKSRRLNSYTPSILKRTKRRTTLSLQFPKDGDTQDAILRAMAAGTRTDLDVSLVLKGDHNGTGTNTFTRIAIDLPKCAVANVTDVYNAEDVMDNGLELRALKPDTSANEIAIVYDTV